MMKAPIDTLNALHGAVAKDLLDKILAGTATAQELQAAIKFLKDNHIEGDLAQNPNLQDLKSTIFPDFQDEDELDA
jgi:hypothetical protein